MSIVINTKMPSNCVFCYERGIGKVINCQLIQSGCANCGRHPNCPLVDIEDIKAEIEAEYILKHYDDGLADALEIIDRKVNEVTHDT